MSQICTSTFDQAACEQRLHSRAQLLSKQRSTQIAHASLSKKHSARTRKLKQPASAQKYHKVAVQMAKRVTSDFKTGHICGNTDGTFQPTPRSTSRIQEEGSLCILTSQGATRKLPADLRTLSSQSNTRRKAALSMLRAAFFIPNQEDSRNYRTPMVRHDGSKSSQ